MSLFMCKGHNHLIPSFMNTVNVILIKGLVYHKIILPTNTTVDNALKPQLGNLIFIAGQ